MSAKDFAMNKGHHDLSMKLPLLNAPDENPERAQVYAHEAFELELKHVLRQQNFPEAEILRLFRGINPGELYDREDPEIKALLQYPIREPQTEVHFRFGVADLMPANEFLTQSYYGCLNDEISHEIKANRMDVILLSPAVSPKRAYRACSHAVSLWDMQYMIDDGQTMDKRIFDKRRAPRNAGRRWRPKSFFVGLTGHKRDYINRDITGVAVGRWPSQGYKPNAEVRDLVQAGTQKTALDDKGRPIFEQYLNRYGRGFICIFPLGVLDMFLRSFVAYTLDEDEEQIVNFDGKVLRATVRKQSIYNRWRNEHCTDDYHDHQAKSPENAAKESKTVSTETSKTDASDATSPPASSQEQTSDGEDGFDGPDSDEGEDEDNLSSVPENEDDSDAADDDPHDPTNGQSEETTSASDTEQQTAPMN